MLEQADPAPGDAQVALDPLAVRARFPALAREVAGRPACFLDGPGGAQVPDVVIDAIGAYLRSSNANDDGAFVTSAETNAVIAAARAAAADLVGATADEIAFGANMTTLNFLLAHAVVRTLEPGDEIVTTALDHEANVSPWLRVAADRGLVVRHAPLRVADGTLDLEALEALVGERTRIVACTLASNALGTIVDAPRVADVAHAAGALAWFDGVHLAPHRRIDRGALRADVVLCSPYKVFGPHMGFAAVRRDLAEAWPADRVRPAAETPPGHRFETGTLAHEALAGLVATVGYLEELGSPRATVDDDPGARRARLDVAFARIEVHERALAERALERFTAIPGLTLHGIAERERLAERTPTFCLTVAGVAPRAVAQALGAQGIFVWDGNYYALSVMQALGLEGHGGAVRVGFLHYNTLAEVDRCADALAAIAAGQS